MQLAKNFWLWEFSRVPKEDLEHFYPECLENLKELAANLQVVREKMGVPLRITSGFRTLTHNRKIGGKRNSYHLKGMAADFFPSTMNLADCYILMKDLMDKGLIKKGGLKMYRDRGFIHYDIRGHYAEW